MNARHTTTENLKSLEITHGSRLSLFSQYWHFMKFITLPYSEFPLYSQQQKRDLKHYECGVFPAHLVLCL